MEENNQNIKTSEDNQVTERIPIQKQPPAATLQSQIDVDQPTASSPELANQKLVQETSGLPREGNREPFQEVTQDVHKPIKNINKVMYAGLILMTVSFALLWFSFKK